MKDVTKNIEKPLPEEKEKEKEVEGKGFPLLNQIRLK